MSDAPPAPAPALGSGVASRFVSSTALDEAKKRREEEWKAAYERIGQEPPKQEEDGTYDPRSLYEKLQENKSKKQEAFEEQLKFKNQFRALDEDEVSFLDSMVEDTNVEERERQKQIAEQLKSFREAVHKRVAPAPPPSSALGPSLSPVATTSSPNPTAAAPKPTAATSASAAPTAALPKKGKRKTLPGVVVKKKSAAAAPPKNAAAAGEEGKKESLTAQTGSKRSAEEAGAGAAGGDTGPAKEDDGAEAKKRKVDDAEASAV